MPSVCNPTKWRYNNSQNEGIALRKTQGKQQKMQDKNLFELTEKQQKAFNRLQEAHKDCIKSGIVFYNNYGWLGALNKTKFKPPYYDDTESENSILDENQNINEFYLDCGEWADDTHFFQPG